MISSPIRFVPAAVFVFTIFQVLPSCVGGAGSPSPDADPATLDDRTLAVQTFARECVGCHGADGKGKGPIAAVLNPAPPDFTDPAWQSSVTDDYLALVIGEGTVAVGKSNAMPPHPHRDRAGFLRELVAIVRQFK